MSCLRHTRVARNTTKSTGEQEEVILPGPALRAASAKQWDSPNPHPDTRQHDKVSVSACWREGSKTELPVLTGRNSEELGPKCCFPTT